MSETPRQTVKRMYDTRDFPDQTCAASRHVALLAEALVKNGFAPSIQNEPRDCGQSMASVVASLWEARASLAAKDAEIERLTRERDEAEHDADEKGHWYRVTEAENERLRRALEFYADQDKWTFPKEDQPDGSRRVWASPIAWDHGARAVAALKGDDTAPQDSQ